MHTLDRILSAQDVYARKRPDVSPARGAEWIATYWQAPVPFALVGRGSARPGSEVYAVVNQNRWVVECPDCHAAQLACVTDRRFLCHVCANVTLDGAWRRVVWPENRVEIERALLTRTDAATRNWLPGETVETLNAETRERTEI